MSLASLVRTAREARGWSLAEAGEVLGVSKPHLHAIEKGAMTNPTLRTIASFVVVYGLRPEALIATALQKDAAVEGSND